MTITDSTTNPPWSLDAVLDACANPSAAVLAVRLGVSTRTIWRWHNSGLSDVQADRIAVALDYHPANIWPDWHDTRQ